MALITSAASGNFNAGATWTGGVVPTVGDEARASTGHTITITANVTCDEVSNAGTGIFTLNNGVTLTANVTNKSTTTSRNCLEFTAASPASATIVGNCTGGTVSTAVAVSHAGSGTLNITGNVLGGSGTSARGADLNSTGALNITGSVTGGTGASAHGVRHNSTGSINITGNVTGSSTASANGASTNSTGGITVTGNATGGGIAGANGVANPTAATITIIGSAIASAVADGATNTSNGIMSVTRAVGNAYGIGAAGGTALAYGLSSTTISGDSRTEELEYGANGAAPTFGAVRIVNKTNNKCIVDLTTGVLKTLADPSDGTGQANQSDVRSGVSYALGNRTGTCAVPAASSVAFGVAVDNTTGTAALTPSAVWNALTSTMTTSGSIGARLKNAATVDTTGQALADALSPTP